MAALLQAGDISREKGEGRTSTLIFYLRFK
jgi:hypothetical protein